MKLSEIYSELLDLAKRTGITVRKENGKFKSGFCVLNDQEVIILNRSTPMETSASILAESLARHTSDSMFIKPAIRDFIERETITEDAENTFSLQIEY